MVIMVLALPGCLSVDRGQHHPRLNIVNSFNDLRETQHVDTARACPSFPSSDTAGSGMHSC